LAELILAAFGGKDLQSYQGVPPDNVPVYSVFSSRTLTRIYLIYSFLSALQQDLQNFLHNNKPTAKTIITTRAIFISPPFLQLYHFPSKMPKKSQALFELGIHFEWI
jgi:hypothetical protein